MSEPSLWQRIKRARVFQVLVVYLGASWGILQIAEILTEALALPSWVLPVTILLLLVGMVVIVATAWVQSLPITSEREERGELPTDWEIAPGDVLSSLRRGRLPHLTWGRAVVGGVVALSLLFGVAGLYVGSTGRSISLGPSEAGATEAAEGIAVVPFDVRGEDLEIWREGMMDLLANGLDGVGGFRTIDARTVMARWQEQVGDAASADLDQTLRVARASGARYAIAGSVVGLGNDVRLVANVYDLVSGRELAQGTAEGPTDDVLRLADELAVGTMRDLLLSIGRSGAGDLSAETLTTSSLPALRDFLEGEAHYRKGRFAEAVQSFERAVAADTTFAIALVRLSEAYGWLEDASSERMRDYGNRAMAHKDRLPPRYQFIMEGYDALNHGRPHAVGLLEEAVQKYPDDPEAWFLLAETYIHVGGATYGTEDELWEALTKAVELDPNFAPYQVHRAEWAVLRGDRAVAEEAVATYERLSGGSRAGMEAVELAIPLLLGDSAEAAQALARAADANERTISLYDGTFGRAHDRFDREEPIQTLLGALQEVSRDAFHAYYAASMGELERGASIIQGPTIRAADRGIYWGHVHELWEAEALEGDVEGRLDPSDCDQPTFNPTCHIFVGMALARTGGTEYQRSVARLRDEAEAVEPEDAEGAEQLRAWAEVLEATALWRRGSRAAGRERLERHLERTDLAGERARLEMGRLEAEEGRPGQALRHFRTALRGYARPVALLGLARMHREIDEEEVAREYYRSLAILTRPGEALPQIVEAREAAGSTDDVDRD